jgi:acyl-CoA synthetase (AMP-forming)/AMP-acid ligase II
MYSSGTTGLPKCMVHGAGGTLVQHLKELALHTDVRSADRIVYVTTCGWMMWNWLVSNLALGATVILYDGAPIVRDRPILWDLVAEERLAVFGTSAKWLALAEKEGLVPGPQHDLSALRAILSTGSPLAAHSFDFVYDRVKRDVRLSSISGGTDIISCFAAGEPTLPVYRGEIQLRSYAMAVDVFDEEGRPVRGRAGELVCTAPFPSMPVAFWNDPDGSRYRSAYFDVYPNAWRHGDWAELTEHDGMIIHGRSDATLNPGGVRIGTAEIYRQVEQLPEIVESDARREAHEQHHSLLETIGARYPLADDETLHDFRKLLHLAVDLCRPDAHATRIERGVAPAVDDQPAMRGQLGPVAMAPDVRIDVEVRRAVLLTIRVVPEAHRHAREGRGAHQLSRLLHNPVAGVIEDLDAHAVAARLQLTAIHG